MRMCMTYGGVGESGRDGGEGSSGPLNSGDIRQRRQLPPDVRLQGRCRTTETPKNKMVNDLI